MDGDFDEHPAYVISRLDSNFGGFLEVRPGGFKRADGRLLSGFVT
jgi:hypothetical protein